MARTTGAGTESPEAMWFPGAALFADISGYTPFAEHICNQSADGPELLSRVLDQAFSNYIDCIQETGGEVACFAGDALIAYWPAEDKNLGLALSMAHYCAQRLHATSLIEQPDQSLEKPRLHIGLAAGNLWVARLGGFDGHWLLLLAGQPVRDASRIAVSARTGETRLTPEAQLLMGTSVSTDSPIFDRTWQRKEQVADSFLRQCTTSGNPGIDLNRLIPRVIREWGERGYSKWISQIRNISVLFIRIEGLDENSPDALDCHQTAIMTLLRALRPYSGSGGTLLLDDKGLIFNLCLGLPHDSHADDPVRAIRAGIGIESELRRLGLRCAAGVATGKGICTSLGGPDRQQYVAVGRFMHLAARLMEKAGQGLLCTKETAALAGEVINLIPATPLQLKGVCEPIEPFSPQKNGRHSVTQEELVGRTHETDRVIKHLSAFEEGHGSILWITGDAGIGKSALVRYLIQVAKSRNLSCLCGGAGSVENDVSFLAWRPIFEQLLKPFNLKWTGLSSLASLPDLLGDSPEKQLVPLVNAVLPGLVEETSLTRSLSGRARVDATISVLSRLIRQCAETPFVLILEDGHWMDSASWRLVEQVARDFTDMLLIITSRLHAEENAPRALCKLEHFSDLTLTPLDREAVGRLVANLLKDTQVDPEIVDEITRRSQGNSLFAREYTLLLASTNRMVRCGGKWRLNKSIPPGSYETLPATVESMITSRLDTLSPDELIAMRAACVVGDRFQEGLIQLVHPEKPRGIELTRVLGALVRQQLLVEVEGDEKTYEFRHALIREGTYGQLTSSQKKELHHETARAFEFLHSSRLAPYFAILAHHWSKAGEQNLTVRYSDLAASQALSSGAYQEAHRLLGLCLDLTETNAQVPVKREKLIRWHRQLADAHLGLGNVEERGAEARRLLILANRTRPHSRAGLLAHATLLAIRCYWQNSPTHQGHAKLDEVYPIAHELAEAYKHSCAVCFFSNDPIGMMYDSLSAVEQAKMEPPSTILANSYADLGGILGLAGLRRIGEKMFDAAIEVAKETGESTAGVYPHMVRCLYAVGLGKWEVAKRSAAICQDLCELMHDHINWANAETVRFWLNHYQAQPNAAWEAAQGLYERAKNTGNRQHQAWSLRLLALGDLQRNQPAHAARQLEDALECLGETTALNERIPTIGALALTKLRMGDVKSARLIAQEGLALAAKVGRPLGHASLEGYSALTEVVIEACRNDASSAGWQREAGRCLSCLRRYRTVFPIGEPRYRFWQGHYRLLNGNQWAARRSFRRGEVAAHLLGMPWDEARCTEALAQILD
ncbi:MAG TPA: AAA family ATPase [Nitrospirales bacterium]|nr:AAA family ATPase [Nitrospirales bacterium]